MKILFLILLVGLQYAKVKDNDLGQTPQMGWTSWGQYGCKQADVLKQAQFMNNSGLFSAGYEYVTIGDCWIGSRCKNKAPYHLKVNNKSFPNMGQLVQQVHQLCDSKNGCMKIGLTSSPNKKTCEHNRDGSLGYETIDAQDWADLKIDYIHYADCKDDDGFNDGPHEPKQPACEPYIVMKEALNKSNRSMLYSIQPMSEQTTAQTALWAQPTANSFRTTEEPVKDFKQMIDMLSSSDRDLDTGSHLNQYIWHDLGLLQIGNNDWEFDEQKTQFSLWAISKSPLIFYQDLTKPAKKQFYEILKQKEIINMNNQSLYPGQCVKGCNYDDDGTKGKTGGNLNGLNDSDPDDTVAIWMTKVKSVFEPKNIDDIILIIVNLDDDTLPSGYKIYASDMGIFPEQGYQLSLQDKWNHDNNCIYNSTDFELVIETQTNIPEHGCLVYQFVKSYTSSEDNPGCQQKCKVKSTLPLPPQDITLDDMV